MKKLIMLFLLICGAQTMFGRTRINNATSHTVYVALKYSMPGPMEYATMKPGEMKNFGCTKPNTVKVWFYLDMPNGTRLPVYETGYEACGGNGPNGTERHELLFNEYRPFGEINPCNWRYSILMDSRRQGGGSVLFSKFGREFGIPCNR